MTIRLVSCVAFLFTALIAIGGGCASRPVPHNPAMTYDHGGVVRGDTSKKQIALIFTGGDFGDGADHVLTTLKK